MNYYLTLMFSRPDGWQYLLSKGTYFAGSVPLGAISKRGAKKWFKSNNRRFCGRYKTDNGTLAVRYEFPVSNEIFKK